MPESTAIWAGLGGRASERGLQGRPPKETHLMSSFDECLVLDSLDLEVNLQRVTIHSDSRSQSDSRMDLSLGDSILLANLCGQKLKGAQKARLKCD